MMFTAKVKGEFEQVQSVEAESVEEATSKLQSGEGEVMENACLGECEISEVSTVEEEAEEVEEEAEEVEPETL